MKKPIQCFCLLIVIISSCHKSKDDHEEFSFKLNVDSTFICNVMIDDSEFVFNEHTHTDAYSRRLFGSDSIIFGFSLYFENSKNESITINISKEFDVDDLGLRFDDSYKNVPINYLPDNIFSGIFDDQDYNFSRFLYMHNDGVWVNYNEMGALIGFGSDWFQKTGGVSIGYKNQTDDLSDSKYMISFISEDSINTLNSLSYFRIYNINLLNNCNLIVEGSFEAYIYSYSGTRYIIKCERFKGYIENIIQNFK